MVLVGNYFQAPSSASLHLLGIRYDGSAELSALGMHLQMPESNGTCETATKHCVAWFGSTKTIYSAAAAGLSFGMPAFKHAGRDALRTVS